MRVRPRRRRRPLDPWARSGLLLMVAGGVMSAYPSGSRAQSVESVAREVVDLEADTASLLEQPLSRRRLRSRTYVEERLTDGELFYRLRDYVRASIIFSDLVENHADHRAYPDALFLLGDSLYRAGDYFGARTRFRRVIERAGDASFRPYVQRALGRLIEIAVHTRDFEGVEDYFTQLSRIPPSEVEAATNYFRAKFLYNRAVRAMDVESAEGPSGPLDLEGLEQARQAFESVQQGSPYFAQARYFIGVVYTLRDQYPRAIEAFRQVLRAPAETQEQREVIDLTRLALGRLHYQTDQLDQAVESYQAVPRTSANFPTALYELAWVYIRMGDSTRAERALEVLAVAAPQSRFIPDAQLLRGNLLLRNGRFDDANTVFRQVAREFGPVRRELEQMLAEHDDPHAYFRALVRENMEQFDASAFLPPAAQRWARGGGDTDRALGVLRDLAQARQLVRETSRLIERLSGALAQPNRVAVFSDLRRQLERATALRNRIARARRDLVRAARGRGRGASGELARLERSFEDMPVDESEFADFDERVLARYRRLGRELARLEVELQGMEARIVAMERYLEDTEEQRDPAGLTAFRNELASHRATIDDYRTAIAQLEVALEAARLQVGVGDARYTRHEQIRAEHRRAVESVRRQMGDSEVTSLFTRLDRVEQQLVQREEAMRRAAEERTQDIQRQVAEESERVEVYRNALTQLEADTEEVVGAVTYANFREVQSRFYDLVLRADVGRINVAWQRREEHRRRVEMLTRDRAQEMRTLDDEFREIMDDTGNSGAGTSGGAQ